MNEFLSHALNPVILIYVVSAMLALGLGQTVSEIVGPLRNVRLTISTVVASYVVLPLLAALTAQFFGLEPGLRYGLVLVAMGWVYQRLLAREKGAATPGGPPSV